MQLQLSLTLADNLYDSLLLRGEPVDFMDAARRLLALRGAPVQLCRQIMDTLVFDDRRFCWMSPSMIGLHDWKLADPDLANVSFVVIDLETTGTRPGAGKITEIGAVRIEGLQVVAGFDTLVNPLRAIPPKVVEITGITAEMVRTAPRIEEVMPYLLDFLKGATLVGHNTAFDLSFLNYELARLNGFRLGDGAFDTVPLARQMAPGLPNYRLGTVASALGSPVDACHRAMADARATAHVFLTLIGRIQELGISKLYEARSFIDPGHKRDHHKLVLTRDLPRSPGAYLFLDSEGRTLYVGKADRLRDRVRSYFLSSADHSRKVRRAVRLLNEVAWEETGSPLEAVVREQQLILEHRPPCNVYGRRPEHYVYVKAGGRGHGLRLYVTHRRTPGSLVVGPFRGRTRVKAALDLLQRFYPIRRCAGKSTEEPCVRGQIGRCLAPCTGDPAIVARHDSLVLSLLGWVMGAPWSDEADQPPTRLEQIIRSLAKQQRFEEAQAVRSSLDNLNSLRRSYHALVEATELRLAVIWPLTEDGVRMGRLNIVWDGHLCDPISLTPPAAAKEIDRALLALEPATTTGDAVRPDLPIPLPGILAVAQEELDLLLAVRRWVIDTPNAITVPFPPGPDEAAQLKAWRDSLVEAVVGLINV